MGALGIETISQRIAKIAVERTITAIELDDLYGEVQRLPPDPPSAQRVKALIDLAAMSLHCIGGSRGSAIAEAATDAARQHSDKALLRYALTVESCWIPPNDTPKALRLLGEALLLARDLRDTNAEAKVLSNIGAWIPYGSLSQRILENALSLCGLRDEVRINLWAALATSALEGPFFKTAAIQFLGSLPSLDLVEPSAKRGDEVHTLTARLALSLCYGMASIICSNMSDIVLAKKYANAFRQVSCPDGPAKVILNKIISAELALAEGMGENAVEGLVDALKDARESGFLVRMTVARTVNALEVVGRTHEALSLLREVIDQLETKEETAIGGGQVIDTFLQDSNLASLLSAANDEQRELSKHAVQLRRELSRRHEALMQAAINADIAAGHDMRRSFRLRSLSMHFGQFLGWQGNALDFLGQAAQFANIGMIALPSLILGKPGVLSICEHELVSGHCEFGARLLERPNFEFSHLGAIVARHHHEQWNGLGYPDGRSGVAIPECARILALCDAFDAMTHPRPWRATPLTTQQALAEIAIESGAQFDPGLAHRFIELINCLIGRHTDLDRFLAKDGDDDQYVLAREQLERIVPR
jgi:HD-GYP domain-containing protein (c-di-GMP phosphodiesterase class II)